MKQCLNIPVVLLLGACGGGEPQTLDAPQGLDTVEMFSGGQGVEGPVSSKLHPDLKDVDIPNVNDALYTRSGTGGMNLKKHETSRQSKAKIRDWLSQKGGSYTFENKGSFGVTTYISQAIRVPSGSYLSYEVQAIFVRNEDNVSMLHDYGLRWECRKEDTRGGFWTIEPCGSTID